MLSLTIKKLIIIIAMCKKTYPKLINFKKAVTTHGYKKYPRSLCSQKILRNTTSHPCRFGPFILRHDWVTGGTKMHATHRSKRRNRGRTMDAAPSQGISSGTLTSGRNRVSSSGGNEGCEKSVTEQNMMSDCWLFKRLEIMRNDGLLTSVTLVIIKIEILINFVKSKN